MLAVYPIGWANDDLKADPMEAFIVTSIARSATLEGTVRLSRHRKGPYLAIISSGTQEWRAQGAKPSSAVAEALAVAAAA